jgi:hypothetical protein
MASDRSVTSNRSLDDVRHILRQARSQAYAAASAAMAEAYSQIGRRIVEEFGKSCLSPISIISGNSTSHFPMRRKATHCVANGQASPPIRKTVSPASLSPTPMRPVPAF